MDAIDHPLVLQPVTLVFDAESESFSFVLTDKAPELYQGLLGLVEGIEEEAVIEFIKLFQSQAVSPLEDIRCWQRLLLMEIHARKHLAL